MVVVVVMLLLLSSVRALHPGLRLEMKLSVSNDSFFSQVAWPHARRSRGAMGQANICDWIRPRSRADRHGPRRSTVKIEKYVVARRECVLRTRGCVASPATVYYPSVARTELPRCYCSS